MSAYKNVPASLKGHRVKLLSFIIGHSIDLLGRTLMLLPKDIKIREVSVHPEIPTIGQLWVESPEFDIMNDDYCPSDGSYFIDEASNKLNLTFNKQTYVET